MPFNFCKYIVVSLLFAILPTTHAINLNETDNISGEKLHKIMLMAHKGKIKGLKKWTETANYLSNNIAGHRFELVPLDWVGMRAYIKTGEADFVLSNPGMYVEFETKYGIKRLVTLKNRRQNKTVSNFGSVIIRRTDRTDIKNIKDLKGKHLIMSSHKAWGGWQLGWWEMLRQGFNPYSELGKLSVSKSHDNTVMSVLSGKADAGVCRTDTLERLSTNGKININDISLVYSTNKQNKKFPFLLSTNLYPEWPFSVSPNVNDELSEEVTKVLLSMPTSSKAAIVGKYYGWTVPDNYQPVHEVLRTLQIRPYENYGDVAFKDIIKHYWPFMLMVLSFISLMIYFVIRFKKINQQLIIAKEIADDANLSKSNFLANMSHELRTPMHGILSYAKMGAVRFQESTPEKNLKYFTNIRTSADRLMAHLNDLLDLAKLESGKMHLTFDEHSFNSIVTSCVDEQRERLKELNIELECVSSNDTIMSEFDDVRIGQVITNFLSNAIKFSESGSKIDVTLKNSSINLIPGILFSIRDYGPGIPNGEYKIIFEKFSQSSNTVIGTTKGTGLGLAICKEIIDLHFGEIWADNHPDGGAIFTFIIPAKHQPTVNIFL